MATALAVVPHSPAPPAVPAFTMSEVERVALAIAKGGLFGSKDPNAVLTLCLLAQAEGQHPATVFRDYHVISGKPAKKAEAMLRDFVNAGGRVEWHTLDDAKADATFSHQGGGSVRITWDMERARKAGISTAMWQKYPRQMLRSRVVSEGIRTIYPGATSGLYVEEEVRDIVGEAPVEEAEAEVVTPRESARERAARESEANGGIHPNNMPDADDFDAAACALRIGDMLKCAPDKAALAKIWNEDTRADRAKIKAADAAIYRSLSEALTFEQQRVSEADKRGPQHDDALDDSIPF